MQLHLLIPSLCTDIKRCIMDYMDNRDLYPESFKEHKRKYQQCLKLINMDSIIIRLFQRFGRKCINRPLNKKRNRKGLITYRYKHYKLSYKLYSSGFIDFVITSGGCRFDYTYNLKNNEKITINHINGEHMGRHMLCWLLLIFQKYMDIFDIYLDI